MFRKDFRLLLRAAVAVSAVAAASVFASSAMAISTGETVAGTALSELSLTAGSPAGRVPVRSTFCRRSLTSSLISVLPWSSCSSLARKSAFSSAVKYACSP